MTDTLRLLNELDNVMADHWDAIANGTPTCQAPIFDVSNELLDAGLGAVLLADRNGEECWFKLDSLKFRRAKPIQPTPRDLQLIQSIAMALLSDPLTQS